MSKLYVDEMYPKTTGQGITQPNLIGFCARGTDYGNGYVTFSSYRNGIGSAILFGNDADTSGAGYPAYMDWNSGHYTPNNGQFKAPVAGVYQLGVAMGIFECDPNEQAYPMVVKNGTGFHYSYWNSGAAGTTYTNINYSFNMKLAVNDVIQITLNGTAGARFYGGIFENKFSMHLIG